MRGHGLLPTSLAVCFHYGRGQLSKPACSLFWGADRSTTDPQTRELAFKPCCRFLRRHGLGSRLEQPHHQSVCAIALALEVCTSGCLPCFEPRDLRLQCLDLCRQQRDGACLASTWWPGGVPYLSEVSGHQG